MYLFFAHKMKNVLDIIDKTLEYYSYPLVKIPHKIANIHHECYHYKLDPRNQELLKTMELIFVSTTIANKMHSLEYLYIHGLY